MLKQTGAKDKQAFEADISKRETEWAERLAAEVALAKDSAAKEVDEAWNVKMEQLRQALIRDKQVALNQVEEQSRV